MKIEIVLPDGAVAGTLTYFCVDGNDPLGAFLANVVLNDMEDGNVYVVKGDGGNDEALR